MTSCYIVIESHHNLPSLYRVPTASARLLISDLGRSEHWSTSCWISRYGISTRHQQKKTDIETQHLSGLLYRSPPHTSGAKLCQQEIQQLRVPPGIISQGMAYLKRLIKGSQRKPHQNHVIGPYRAQSRLELLLPTGFQARQTSQFLFWTRRCVGR